MRPETLASTDSKEDLGGSSASLGPLYSQLHGLRLRPLCFFHQVEPLDKNGTLLLHLLQVRTWRVSLRGKMGEGDTFL